MYDKYISRTQVKNNNHTLVWDIASFLFTECIKLIRCKLGVKYHTCKPIMHEFTLGKLLGCS